MAVAFDVAQSTTGNFVSSLTTAAFTVSSSADRAIAAGISWSGTTVSSVAGAGVTLDSQGAAATSAGGISVQQYAKANPSSGSQTATVTFGDANGLSLGIGICTFIGADQTTPTSGYTTATGSGSGDLTVTASPAPGADDFVMDTGFEDLASASAAGADQTSRWNTGAFIGSTQDGAAGGVMSWTHIGVGAWAMTTVIIETVAAAGRTTKNTRAWPLGTEIGMNWRGAA